MKSPKNSPFRFLSSAGWLTGLRVLLFGLTILLMFAPVYGPVYGQWDSVLGKLKGANQVGLSDANIGSGRKEALQVGTENAVKSTGKPDGYFANEALKLLLPAKLKTMGLGLRIMGNGPESGSSARSFCGRVICFAG